ncbi:MAG: sigma-70 family RNA polymerase sigma factor [bacterium]|nr:sigma-70 family RNA polymerase sigma factor [bacterium]
MKNTPESSQPPRDDVDLRQQLEQLTPRLLVWSHMRLQGQPGAEDLTQETLCRALMRLDSFQGGNLAAWVFAIGKHVLMEHFRRVRKERRIRTPQGRSTLVHQMGQIAADMTTLTRRVAKREDLRNTLEIVDELGETDRTIAVLCGMEQRPCRIAATQLGMSEAAVTKRWSRLRASLRERAAWLVE